MTSHAISTVTQILKKISASEPRKTSDSSLPEYKPMPQMERRDSFRLQRESSLPRVELERPRPLNRTASDPGASPSSPSSSSQRSSSSTGQQPSHLSYVLHNENYSDGRRDRSQKLLTNTKRVRGLRSFLWIKPPSSSGQASFVCQLVPCLLANLGCLSTGLALGFSALLLPWVTQEDGLSPSPGQGILLTNASSPDFSATPLLGSGIASIFWLGALLGACLAPWLTSRLGSRVTLLLLTIPDLLGWVLLACPPSTLLLLLGRLLTGLATGGYLPTIRHFTCEVAQEERRPLLLLLPLPSMALGTLLVYSLGLLLSPSQAAILLTTAPVLLAVSMVILRDTPYWLQSLGRDGDALSALQRLRGGDTGAAVTELVALQRQMRDRLAPPDLMEGVLTIWRQHRDKFAEISGFVFLMVYCGKFSVDFFAIQLLQRAGSHPNEHLSAVIVAFLYVVGCILLILLSRSLSRKSLYIFSALAGAASLAVFGLCAFTQASSMTSLTFLALFMLTAPLGLTSLPFTLLEEGAFPAQLAPLAGLLTLLLGLLHLLLATLLLPLLLGALGLHTVAWLQAGLCLLAAPLGLRLLPGPRSKEQESLTEVDKFAGLRRDRARAWVSPMHYTHGSLQSRLV